MYIQETFAKNMHDLRRHEGMSQEALAELAGLHRTYIGGIEQRNANISLKSVERIADALEVDPWVLLAPDGAEREIAAREFTDAAAAAAEEAPVLAPGGYALCSWNGDDVQLRPIGVFNEDLTLRILCILAKEGHGGSLSELAEAYSRVSGPVLDFVRTYLSGEHTTE